MYYAYFLEDEDIKEIVDSWQVCQNNTKGKNARFKKFQNYNEAQKWLDEGAIYSPNPKKQEIKKLPKDAIYFDSGTGRNVTTEVKVCDVHGNSLLPFIMPQNKINEFGNYFLSEGRTNNFGELTGLFIALKYTQKYPIKKICGDSKLVIDFWSKGNYNKENLDDDTIDLILKVIPLRKEFEKNGGEIIFVSGDINPADLGFHK